MIKMTSKDMAFIRQYVDDADGIIERGQPRELLIALFDVITKKGLDDYYNDLGEEAQDVYDSIYFRN